MGIIKRSSNYEYDQRESEQPKFNKASASVDSSIIKGIPDVKHVIQVEAKALPNKDDLPQVSNVADESHSTDLFDEDSTPVQESESLNQKSGLESAYDDGLQVGKEQGYKDGQAAGYEEGHQKGLEEGRAQMESEAMKKANDKWDQHGDSITQLINDVKTQSESLEKEAEKSILELVLKISEKVIRRSIETDSSVISDMITEELLKLKAEGKATIRVHSDLAEQVREQLPHLKQKFSGYSDVVLQEDQTLEPGACILETNSGFIDLSVQTSMELINELFTQIYNQDSTE